MDLCWGLDMAILVEGQELFRSKSSDLQGKATPPSAKSAMPLRGEVKSLRGGVAPISLKKSALERDDIAARVGHATSPP